MGDRSGPTTSVTLMGRLRQTPSNADAWTEFADRYAPLVYRWCMRWGVQDADAQDLTQTILVKLLQSFERFSYDPERRFRSWLKTVTHNAWLDAQRSRKRTPAAVNTDATIDPLDTAAARDDLAAELEAAYERDLLAQAAARVQLRVQPATWEAFRMTVMEGIDSPTVARKLKIPVASVYKARSNVQKLLHEEVRYLEGEGS